MPTLTSSRALVLLVTRWQSISVASLRQLSIPQPLLMVNSGCSATAATPEMLSSTTSTPTSPTATDRRPVSPCSMILLKIASTPTTLMVLLPLNTTARARHTTMTCWRSRTGLFPASVCSCTSTSPPSKLLPGLTIALTTAPLMPSCRLPSSTETMPESVSAKLSRALAVAVETTQVTPSLRLQTRAETVSGMSHTTDARHTSLVTTLTPRRESPTTCAQSVVCVITPQDCVIASPASLVQTALSRMHWHTKWSEVRQRGSGVPKPRQHCCIY
mmetsp:Transcript_48576/g.72074  ORF Transcript_48576/g.72074 Transcript_48576/m.72074 type:complete len:273 (-) Transcript_48576:24-842(-)